MGRKEQSLGYLKRHGLLTPAPTPALVPTPAPTPAPVPTPAPTENQEATVPYTEESLLAMKIVEIRSIARFHGIPNYNRYSKLGLIRVVLEVIG